jgi:hypothetical protein
MYGSVSFKVNAGTYVYGAFVDGLPPPPETTINITASASGSLVISLPTITIGGSVLKNGTDPVSNASSLRVRID